MDAIYCTWEATDPLVVVHANSTNVTDKCCSFGLVAYISHQVYREGPLFFFLFFCAFSLHCISWMRTRSGSFCHSPGESTLFLKNFFDLILILKAFDKYFSVLDQNYFQKKNPARHYYVPKIGIPNLFFFLKHIRTRFPPLLSRRTLVADTRWGVEHRTKAL